jgi:hypothetical protein
MELKIMRYLTMTYVTRANGKVDEVMAVARNIKRSDLQTCNVILDFRRLEVVKCTMNGTNVPRDWDRVVGYYHQHYASTIERLFNENGYEIVKPEEPKPAVESASDPS